MLWRNWWYALTSFQWRKVGSSPHMLEIFLEITLNLGRASYQTSSETNLMFHTPSKMVEFGSCQLGRRWFVWLDSVCPTYKEQGIFRVSLLITLPDHTETQAIGSRCRVFQLMLLFLRPGIHEGMISAQQSNLGKNAFLMEVLYNFSLELQK